MKDQIVSEKEIVSDSYLSVKGQTYEELGTDPLDWHPCDIKGYVTDRHGNDQPIYDIPKSYTRAVTRFTRPIDANCNLCGHEIINKHYIQNDSKQLYMLVGSECVMNRYGRVVRKKIKKIKDSEIREKAKVFLQAFIKWCDTQKEFEKPKTAWEAQRIKREYFIAKGDALELLDNFSNVTSRKLNNFMKKFEFFKKIAPTSQELGEFIIMNINQLVDAHTNKQNYKIGFGKYKDQTVSEVSEDYLIWCKKKIEEQP